MKNVMLIEQNPETRDWLCWIPNTPQAYYYGNKKTALKFVNKVNKAFDKGDLYFNEVGKVCKK